jgi:hypothetical protein
MASALLDRLDDAIGGDDRLVSRGRRRVRHLVNAALAGG